MTRSAAALACLLLLGGCPAGEQLEPPAPVVRDVSLAALSPGLVLPGSRVVLEGSSFLPDFVGPSTLVLEGTFSGVEVSITLPALFEDYAEMWAWWPGAIAAGLPADEGLFVGEAKVQTQSALDGLVHESEGLPVQLDLRAVLAPRLDHVRNEVLFVNDPLVLEGDGFLLGGDEGASVAVIQGCFQADGESSCAPVGPTEIVGEPYQDPFDRQRLVVPFSPRIAGIVPGTFTGTVRVSNRQGVTAGGLVNDSAEQATSNELVEPVVFSFSPSQASLGQYVDVAGGGFVGQESGAPPGLTTIELEGQLAITGAPNPTAVTLDLVPEFESGSVVRYVVSEQDALGQLVDLRAQTATFTGTARPVVQYGADTVTGSASSVTFGVTFVRQVVWLRFLPTYVESLRHFGLRAADSLVRDRVLTVVRRDYAAVNVDWRTDEPTDFALYASVEIGGPDPNGLGLIGYDNTTGKDDGNERLYDKIGGVNALTQEDGYPGYGGVFVDSLFTFSQHPGAWTGAAEVPEPLFDALFDPFRPDVGNAPVAAGELASGSVPTLQNSVGCPSSDRAMSIACAIWTLGSLIGTTTSHEFGHSLGLADPWGTAIHNDGDYPNALMDAGSARTFRERGELDGEGPGVFCVSQFEYLQQILPTGLPDPLPGRLQCY